jgi:peptidoglycan hydrolase-like protein with peptidoglycan-binding domain
VGRVVSKPSDNVRLGDTGPGMKQIQTALAGLGYKVATDASFGPQTAQAVKAFQKKSSITQDGIVGPVTWAKIQAASTAPAATTTATATTTTTTH